MEQRGIPVSALSEDVIARVLAVVRRAARPPNGEVGSAQRCLARLGQLRYLYADLSLPRALKLSLAGRYFSRLTLPLSLRVLTRSKCFQLRVSKTPCLAMQTAAIM